MIDSAIRDFLAFAAKHNIVVIPMKYSDKLPLIPWKELQSRHPTQQEIDGWFRSRNNVNIGVVCGTISGGDGFSLVVVDIDSMEVYNALCPDGSPTRAVKTSRGIHLYFLVRGMVPKTKLEIKMPDGSLAGIDIQGEGTCVVAPGSVHETGHIYAWANDKEIMHVEAETPEYFSQVITARLDIVCKQKGWEILNKEVKHDIDRLLDGVGIGRRNNSGYLLAAYYRQGGKTDREALAQVMEWNQKNQPPLLDSEITAIVQSCYKPGAKYNFNFGGEGGADDDPLAPYYEKKRLRTDLIAKDMMEEMSIKTIRDTEEILFYED